MDFVLIILIVVWYDNIENLVFYCVGINRIDFKDKFVIVFYSLYKIFMLIVDFVIINIILGEGNNRNYLLVFFGY